MKYAVSFFIFFCLFSNGQNLQISYTVSSKLNAAQPDSLSSKTMVLDIADQQSLFRDLEDRKSDSLALSGKNYMRSLGFENQMYIRKNAKEKTTGKLIRNSQFNYYLPVAEPLKWEILSDQKKIGKYRCQKARVEYGGRKCLAWFTTEIPLSEGPYVFQGLPGLILEVTDEAGDYQFTFFRLKNTTNLLDARKKAITIDWPQYQKLALDFYANPNFEMEQLAKRSSNVQYIDKDGNQIQIDYKKENKEQQNYIKANNNPVELNQRINYE